MNEALVEAVVAEVLRRQREDRPRALLLGRKPEQELGWEYVACGEYAAVMIGSMSAGDLLHFPDDASAGALLAGKPVYVWEAGLDYRRFSKTANRLCGAGSWRRSASFAPWACRFWGMPVRLW